MRPINLIPAEERAGQRRPLRGGPIAYLIVGALAAMLIGVITLVVTDNQIGERNDEIASLQRETAAVEARANSLQAYTQFHSVREQRVATISSLADSRFDWVRVMRELALVLPDDVWLTNLTGSASPSVAPSGAAGVALRATIPGPALELVGCASSQQAVAGFVQALKEIDGVTRVGLQGSTVGGGAESGSAASSCQTRSFIAQFQMVVAFDAAPIAPEVGSEGATAPPAAEAAPETAESTESSASAEGAEG